MTTEYIDIEPPGVLLREIIEDLEISQYRLAKAIGKAPIQVKRIIDGKAAITPAMSLLLGRALGMSPNFWRKLQTLYDLRMAERETDTEGVEVLRESA